MLEEIGQGSSAGTAKDHDPLEVKHELPVAERCKTRPLSFPRAGWVKLSNGLWWSPEVRRLKVGTGDTAICFRGALRGGWERDCRGGNEQRSASRRRQIQ